LKHLEPVAIRNKYDLMHHNTPSFASTVVTWDTSKMGAITKKRVIHALQTGDIKYSRGDAASMYHQLRLRFGLPNYTIQESKPVKADSSRYHGGYIRWENASDKLLQAINTVYLAEKVIRRLAGEMNHTPWYLQKEVQDNKEHGYFYMDHPHDLTEINAEVTNIMNSPDIAAKREEAVQFVEEGGTFSFTWR